VNRPQRDFSIRTLSIPQFPDEVIKYKSFSFLADPSGRMPRGRAGHGCPVLKKKTI
jgi:hypothetical protein